MTYKPCIIRLLANIFQIMNPIQANRGDLERRHFLDLHKASAMDFVIALAARPTIPGDKAEDLNDRRKSVT